MTGVDYYLQAFEHAIAHTNNNVMRLKYTRNRAILLLGFWKGFRSDELSRLDIEFVNIQPSQGLELFLPYSKNDREHQGETYRVPALLSLCPVRAVEDWLALVGLEWIDWSLESQAIHGIKRSELLNCGVDAARVLTEMKTLLGDESVIYSDNPYWESRWLACLGDFGCEVRNIRELIPASRHSDWAMDLEHHIKVHRLTRHRADHDAYALYLTIMALRSNA